ncbi:MAG: transcription elongation factor GreB [Candidatus Thiodiazotropha sp. 6PLUC2]
MDSVTGNNPFTKPQYRSIMGRYRPPSPPKSPYITESGYETLKQEAHDLWIRRRDVTKALAAAAAEGDRSENAEYIYRKKELREIDYRIRYLQKRIPILKVVNQPPSNPDQVFFAAWVQLETEDGDVREYRIVGPDELDSDPKNISLDSPLAQVLLKRTLDDQIEVETPAGITRYWIVDVRYELP